MNDLKRELAPIDERGWKEIEEEVTRTLKRFLAGRRLVDFDGPHGWQHSNANVGRVRELETPPLANTEARLREVQPLVEFRVPFELSRGELDAISRGADDADLNPAIGAGRKLALAENQSIFHGYAAAGIRGLSECSSHAPISPDANIRNFPQAVSEAIERLREAGIHGPYALAVEPKTFAELSKTEGPGGYPVLRHVERLVDEPVVWAPGLDGAVVLSLRGDDFRLTVGRDISIGYLDHDPSAVRLYLEESLTFRVFTPEAVTIIRPRG